MPLKKEKEVFLWNFQGEITLENSTCGANHRFLPLCAVKIGMIKFQTEKPGSILMGNR
jgi:hypothetical protein